MIIKSNDIKSTNVPDIIIELEKKPEIMNFIYGNNLPTGDYLEAIAIILADDCDADLNSIAYALKNNIF